MILHKKLWPLFSCPKFCLQILRCQLKFSKQRSGITFLRTLQLTIYVSHSHNFFLLLTGLWNKVQVQSITFHFGLQSGYLFWDIRHDIKQLCGSHESHWQWLKIQSDPSRTNYVLSTVSSSTTRELQDRKKERKKGKKR